MLSVKMTEDGLNYVDDNIIPITDEGKIDASWYMAKNEGMRISVILTPVQTNPVMWNEVKTLDASVKGNITFYYKRKHHYRKNNSITFMPEESNKNITINVPTLNTEKKLYWYKFII